MAYSPTLNPRLGWATKPLFLSLIAVFGTLTGAQPAAKPVPTLEIGTPELKNSGKVATYIKVRDEKGVDVSGLTKPNFKVRIGDQEAGGLFVDPTFQQKQDRFGIVLVVDLGGIKSTADPLWNRVKDAVLEITRNKNVQLFAVVPVNGSDETGRLKFGSSLEANRFIDRLKPRGDERGKTMEGVANAIGFSEGLKTHTKAAVVALLTGPLEGSGSMRKGERPVFILDLFGEDNVKLEQGAQATGGGYYAVIPGRAGVPEQASKIVSAAIASVADLYFVAFDAPKGADKAPGFTVQVERDGQVYATGEYKPKPFLLYLIAAALIALVMLAALAVAVRRVMAANAGGGGEMDYSPHYSSSSSDTQGMDMPVFSQAPAPKPYAPEPSYAPSPPMGSSSFGDSTAGEFGGGAASPFPVGDRTEGEATATLRVTGGAMVGQRFPLAGTVVIGRESSSRPAGPFIGVSGDSKISRQHAELRMESGSGRMVCRLTHLSQTNQTYVNEKSVRDQVLKNGDKIRMGDTVFTYEDAGSDSAYSGGGYSPGDVTAGDSTL